MTKEDLLALKQKLSKLSEEEQKKRNLYLRDLASGELQGPLTGYPSIDKPWLKWHKRENITLEWPKTNVYDYLLQMADNENVIIEYVIIT